MLEEQATQGKAASEILSQMINAGHVQQDTENSVILAAANGEHRFGINAPEARQAEAEFPTQDHIEEHEGN